MDLLHHRHWLLKMLQGSRHDDVVEAQRALELLKKGVMKDHASPDSGRNLLEIQGRSIDYVEDGEVRAQPVCHHPAGTAEFQYGRSQDPRFDLAIVPSDEMEVEIDTRIVGRGDFIQAILVRIHVTPDC